MAYSVHRHDLPPVVRFRMSPITPIIISESTSSRTKRAKIEIKLWTRSRPVHPSSKHLCSGLRVSPFKLTMEGFPVTCHNFVPSHMMEVVCSPNSHINGWEKSKSQSSDEYLPVLENEILNTLLNIIYVSTLEILKRNSIPLCLRSSHRNRHK